MFDSINDYDPSQTGNTSMQPMILQRDNSYRTPEEQVDSSHLAEGSFGPDMIVTPQAALSTIHESQELAKASYTSSKYYEELVNKQDGIPQKLIQDQLVTLPQLNQMHINLMNGEMIPLAKIQNRRAANHTGLDGVIVNNPKLLGHGDHRSNSNLQDSMNPNVNSQRPFGSELSHLSYIGHHNPPEDVPSRLIRGGGTPFNPYQKPNQGTNSQFITPYKNDQLSQE
jgi:hypothetical protein